MKTIKYLENHSVTVISYNDSKIIVMSVYCMDGIAHEEQVSINNDMESVRNFLGY